MLFYCYFLYRTKISDKICSFILNSISFYFELNVLSGGNDAHYSPLCGILYMNHKHSNLLMRMVVKYYALEGSLRWNESSHTKQFDAEKWSISVFNDLSRKGK